MTSGNFLLFFFFFFFSFFFFFDVVGELDHVAFNENRNVVFIWSVEMCFSFVAQINVTFMRPLYETSIVCDCILK